MKLYAFGSNGSGQLGIGHDEDVSIPTECLFQGLPSSSTASTIGSAKITRIAAGGNHTLVLFSDGAVYAAGCNEDGRCGWSSSETASQTEFRRVVVEDTVDGVVVDTFKDVSATWEATFLVSEGDKVIVFGSGAKGELGLGTNVLRAFAPATVPDFPPSGARVVSIASGMGHTVVVLSNGEVYGWGAARKGQLGESAMARKTVWAPVKVDVDGAGFGAVGAACGREFTVILGDNAAGEFAVLGSCDDKWGIRSGAPAPSSLVGGYRGLFASWHGVYIHQGDSSVVAWGRNDRGQLPPGDLPKPSQLAAGSEHALAVIDNQTVVAFGWGEHGNCGPDVDARGNVQGRFSRVALPIERGSGVVGVGAGCATSWIIVS